MKGTRGRRCKTALERDIMEDNYYIEQEKEGFKMVG